MFNQEQTDALRAPLNASHVKQTQGNDYIEGWWAIAEANRIFGEGNWNRETIDLRLVEEGEKSGGSRYAAYVAQVRISVTGRDENGYYATVTRIGTGFGSGFGKWGTAHESAAKEAETDAMKRALMTFGNPFGLALYDKKKANVESPAEAKKREAEQKYGLTTEQRNKLQEARQGKDAKEVKKLYKKYGLLSEEPIADNVVDAAIEEIKAL